MLCVNYFDICRSASVNPQDFFFVVVVVARGRDGMGRGDKLF